jgi:hypothetical protein
VAPAHSPGEGAGALRPLPSSPHCDHPPVPSPSRVFLPRLPPASSSTTSQSRPLPCADAAQHLPKPQAAPTSPTPRSPAAAWCNTTPRLPAPTLAEATLPHSRAAQRRRRGASMNEGE